ncbi:M15 family metallopeptidase [Nocardioides campestrisoli]|uniref:M15 family metallopeptidase n=1 Tax=Nocardioides campestrisoli TaxID=2736757 RepID=UPI0015E681B0|nr:M15 family metallopeptidase [Nocardioides campestrisoli]
MRALLVSLLGTAAVLAGLPVAPAASSAAPGSTARDSLAVRGSASGVLLTLTSAPGPADDLTSVTLTATGVDGLGLANAPVTIERVGSGSWVRAADVVTDAAGVTTFALPVARTPDDNRLRATYAGDATHPAAVSAEHALTLVPRESRLRLRGPRRVVDEQTGTLRVEWTTARGAPVAGPVQLQRRLVARPGERMTPAQRRAQPWRTVQQVETAADGSASVEVRPRATFRWRAVVGDQSWLSGTRSRVLTLRNLPPGVPVRLPRAAPRPRISLPPQPRATGPGVHAVVREIPDGVWRQMVGRSWRPGCPVGRAGLRLVQLNYYDFDGYRRRGELVVNAGITGQVVSAFTEWHERRMPIRSMYRVDRFGWSPRLRGADDYASMAAGNTSAFNCRQVVGNPRVRSPHSWGRSVDINPWENPYRSRAGIVPNTWWASRSHARVAWRSPSHPVVALMRRHGFRWTYGRRDNHHFDAAGATGRLAAVLAGDRCGGVCK